jgi:putative ABC transport system substrate-binding protein
MNNRRKLIVALGAGALVAPFGSFAQQQNKIWRVGFLAQSARPESLDSSPFGAFIRGMREFRYIEGRNLVVEWRFSDNNLERLPELAADLVRLKVDVIATQGTPASRAAQQATTTIPIVMVNVGDPVGSGFVKSLAHPGGNMTGLSNLSPELVTKQLEMLLSMVPKLSRVAVLVNPANSVQAGFLKRVQAAGQKTNVRILPVEARTAQELDKAFADMIRERAGALIVSFDALFSDQRRRIAELAAKHRLPSIAARKEDVDVGYLMSYGPKSADIFRHAATYVDKILKGAKPGDLPVEQPTKFELFINRKTAKALGLTIPQSLLISADKVIE